MSTALLIVGLILSLIPLGIFLFFCFPVPVLYWSTYVIGRIVYRLRIVGVNNVPRTGGALLTPNHVSWIDGLILLVTVPRRIRFIIYADYVNLPSLNWLARAFNVIPIKSTSGPKALMQSLRDAKTAIEAGDVVCIFAEGALTRTGQLQAFQPGFLRIVQGTGAPVVPVCLNGLWGSIFSYEGGRFFWKWPRRQRRTITIHFGEPIIEPKSPSDIRFAIQSLGANIVDQQKDQSLIPARKFLRACRQAKSRWKIADSTGLELNGGKLLAATLVFRRQLLKVIAADEKHVGVFLPPTVGGALANLALTCAGRVAVNLNYTLSDDDLRYSVKSAGLKHIVTSRKMLEKRPCELGAEWVFLEDLKEQVTRFDKMMAAIGAYVLPIGMLERRLGLLNVKPDDLLTIIFTSGSTGEPKGVMLSQYNISATVDAVSEVIHINQDDVVLGVVPLFHSLGYTAALWLPMCVPASVVYHVNPLDARVIGELADKYGASILFSTPTFLRTYLKRCTPEQFRRLDLPIVGAEKLPRDLAEQFHEKFGRYPLEGYGATENSGPVSVNIPDHRCDNVVQTGSKLGTVGRPLPGCSIRAKNPDTGEWLDANEEGLIQLRGPNIMLGYWQQPEKTKAVLTDGWYNTGDMGYVDDEGFVHITGRLSRFSKMGGEMVPHIRIEEVLVRILEERGVEETEPMVAVTAVPDPKKGERLVVLHRTLPISVAELLRKLEASGMPNLWLPSSDSFFAVEKIPLLGSGKLDLKSLRERALEFVANEKGGSRLAQPQASA